VKCVKDIKHLTEEMRRLLLFIDSFILWLLLTWALNTQSLLVGIGVSLLVTLIFGERFSRKPIKWFEPQRYFWLIVLYMPFFAWQCIKANLDVAYRVLHPKMPIEPGIVKVRTRLKSKVGRTVLANSITMTPGTLSVDIKDEYLYIHWIKVYAKDEENATRIIVKKFERFLVRIFE